MWNPIWSFDFKISILKHIVNLEPGKADSHPCYNNKNPRQTAET